MEKVTRYTGENFSRGWMEYLSKQPNVKSMWIECDNGKWAICVEYGDSDERRESI